MTPPSAEDQGTLTPPEVHLEPRPKVVFYRDWRWVAAVAALTLGVALSIFAYSNVQTSNTVNKTQDIVTQIKGIGEQNTRLGEQNKQTLDALAQNQAGINELVNFVHQVQQQQSQQSSNGQSEVVKQLEQILCSSSDPVRIAACRQLGLKPVGG